MGPLYVGLRGAVSREVVLAVNGQVSQYTEIKRRELLHFSLKALVGACSTCVVP